MKILRIKIMYTERISAHEWLVNCIVIYRADNNVSREARIQFRIPEITEQFVCDGVCTTIQTLDRELKFIEQFNETH